jgi:hypothetical protein
VSQPEDAPHRDKCNPKAGISAYLYIVLGQTVPRDANEGAVCALSAARAGRRRGDTATRPHGSASFREVLPSILGRGIGCNKHAIS